MLDHKSMFTPVWLLCYIKHRLFYGDIDLDNRKDQQGQSLAKLAVITYWEAKLHVIVFIIKATQALEKAFTWICQPADKT